MTRLLSFLPFWVTPDHDPVRVVLGWVAVGVLCAGTVVVAARWQW